MKTQLAYIQQYIATQFHYAHRLPALGLSKTEKVHEVRLILKRLRAVATLLKAFPGFLSLNDQLKKLSRTLAPTRDKDVVDEWLSKHHKATPDHLLAEYRSLSKPRAKSLQSVCGKLRLLESEFNSRLGELREAKIDWRRTTLDSYQKVKKALGRAKQSKKSSDLHILRARTKNFQYQMEALHLAPRKIESFLQKINKLTSLLGDSHDLTLVRQSLKNLQPKDLDPVRRDLKHQRKKMEREAIKLAKKFLKKKPPLDLPKSY